MIDFTVLQDAIYDWINGQSGNEVVWQFQNGIIPNKPFFATRLTSFEQQGEAELRVQDPPSPTGVRDIYSSTDFVLEILGFGVGIVQDTVNLQLSLNNPQVLEPLNDAGVIVWNSLTPVTDISGIDNDENEERSLFEVNMRTCDLITNVDLGCIESVNIQGTYKQDGKPDRIVDIAVETP